MNGYGVFLTIELARIASIIPVDLEYDLTWEKGEALYESFLLSRFNNSSKPEYDGIVAFLKDYMTKNSVVATEERDRRTIKKAIDFLCDSDELSIAEQVKRIRDHKNGEDFIDSVAGVVVWDKVEFAFTCKEFLDLIESGKL